MNTLKQFHTFNIICKTVWSLTVWQFYLKRNYLQKSVREFFNLHLILLVLFLFWNWIPHITKQQTKYFEEKNYVQNCKEEKINVFKIASKYHKMWNFHEMIFIKEKKLVVINFCSMTYFISRNSCIIFCRITPLFYGFRSIRNCFRMHLKMKIIISKAIIK